MRGHGRVHLPAQNPHRARLWQGIWCQRAVRWHCPGLSALAILFILVLSVIMEDANWERAGSRTDDVEYADDTALICKSSACLQRALDSLLSRAAQYGLLPNWDKTAVLQVGDPPPIYDPNGQPIPKTEQHIYLGGLLTTSGRARCAVARRVGEARNSFSLLTK
eukprot:1689810-Pyramimonas_sp.AAC.1